jgi:hypothetical protein
MNRNTPMKRTGFKRTPRRPEKRMDDYTPKPRETAVASAAPDSTFAPQPKFVHLRDERFRDMCRDMRCQHCGAWGAHAGVTWAHSNQSKHGKGGAIKASDQYVAAMCSVCHRELDQGKLWTQEEKVEIWDEAHRRTVLMALRKGTWPSGVPVPLDEYRKRQERPVPAEPEVVAMRGLRGRQLVDKDYYDVLAQNDSWMSAQDVSRQLGVSWYICSFGLRRMVEGGTVEEDVIDVAGAARSAEHSRVYRARPLPGESRRVESDLPAWMAPQAVVNCGVARRINGTAGMLRWDRSESDQSDNQGDPGGPENGAASTTEMSSGLVPVGSVEG